MRNNRWQHEVFKITLKERAFDHSRVMDHLCMNAKVESQSCWRHERLKSTLIGQARDIIAMLASMDTSLDHKDFILSHSINQ